MLVNAMEELFTILRGAYLILLFSPAILCAPLCIGLGYQRGAWVKVCPPRVCTAPVAFTQLIESCRLASVPDIRLPWYSLRQKRKLQRLSHSLRPVKVQ